MVRGGLIKMHAERLEGHMNLCHIIDTIDNSR